MAGREWGDLSPEDRHRLESAGITPSQWETGSVGGLGRISRDDSSSGSGRNPTAHELAAAVADPDSHQSFWRARAGGQISGQEKERLIDDALRNSERELGDRAKYSRISEAERMESMTPRQLRITGVMTGSVRERMARWANERRLATGTNAYNWLFYH